MCTIANSAGVDLVARLQRVAAVDEQRGARRQHDRDAGRAGEAGQPGQPLLGGRHVFVLVAVGARHDEAGEAAPFSSARNAASAAGVAPVRGSSNDWNRASNIAAIYGALVGAATAQAI